MAQSEDISQQQCLDVVSDPHSNCASRHPAPAPIAGPFSSRRFAEPSGWTGKNRNSLRDSGTLRRWGPLSIALILLAFGPDPARAGLILQDAVANFTASNVVYGDFLEIADFPILSGSNDISFGAIIGSKYTGYYGAKASAGASVGVSGRAVVGQQSAYDYAYRSGYTTGVLWDAAKPKPFLGDSFFLASKASPIGLDTLNLRDSGAEAALSVAEKVGLSAGAKACLVGCIGVDFKIALPTAQQNLMSFSAADNGSLKVLGQTVANALPYTYKPPGGVIQAQANLPRFETAIHNVLPGGAISYESRQNLVGISANVAQIFADAVGLPFPLSGSLAGFDYSLLEILLGLGLDLDHSFNLDPHTFDTAFTFSSPVQIRDSASGLWGAPTSEAAVKTGKTLELRTADPVTSLGIQPTYRSAYHIEADWSLSPYLAAAIRAIEVSGYGLDLGPLLDKSVKKPLGDLSLHSVSLDKMATTTGKPINLAFGHLPTISLPDQPPVDVCASLDCLQTGFVSTTEPTDDGWFAETTYRVDNYESVGCGLGRIADCDIDPFYTPTRTYFIPSPDNRGTYVLAENPEMLMAINGGADLSGGASSNDDLMQILLQDLGVDVQDPALGRSIGHGALPLVAPVTQDIFISRQAVPEPDALPLFVFGLAGLGFLRRRDRRLRRRRGDN